MMQAQYAINQRFRLALAHLATQRGLGPAELAGRLALGRALPVEVGESAFFSPGARAILGERTEVALAPLFTDREFIGVVVADFAGAAGWRRGEGDITGVEIFATLSGTLLYNVWLYAELENKNRELQIRVRELALMGGEMTRVLNRSRSPEANAGQMLAPLVQTMKARRGFLFLYDFPPRELNLFASYELSPGFLEGGEVIAGISPERGPAASRRPRRSGSLARSGKAPLRAARSPLKSRDRFVGLWGLVRDEDGQPLR